MMTTARICRLGGQAVMATALLCSASHQGLEVRYAASRSDSSSSALGIKSPVPFETEVLANRAIHHGHAFSIWIRALVNRWYSASLIGGPGEAASEQPVQGAAAGLGDQSQTPQSFRGSPDDLGEELRNTGSDWNVLSLHAASVDSMQYLNLMVSFGVMQPPLIKDLEGQLGPARTVEEAIAFLQQHPRAFVLFRWQLREAPLEAQLLNDFLDGGFLPLRPGHKMDYLRQRLRDIRIIWVVTSTTASLPPSRELRDAAEELLTFAATFSRIQEVDPTLAILASEAGGRKRRPRRERVSEDLWIGEATQELAEDFAVWEGDYDSAWRSLDEARRFLDQTAAAAAAKREKARFDVLSLRDSRIRAELTLDPGAFASRARTQTWQDASSKALGLLSSAIGKGLTVAIPGKGVGKKSPGGELDIAVMVVTPSDRNQMTAPWLYGLEVSILQPVDMAGRDESVAITGLPIALVDTLTGRRHVRRLIHDESEIPEYELSAASFLNLERGIYRVEFVSPTDPPPGAISTPGTPDLPGKVSVWRRVLSVTRFRWNWPRWSRHPTDVQRSTRGLHSSA